MKQIANENNFHNAKLMKVFVRKVTFHFLPDVLRETLDLVLNRYFISLQF